MTSDQISSNEPLRWSADGLFYQLFIITNETFISTAGIWWIESTQLGLTVDRIVVASDPRNVVVVVIRNVPHPTLPDGPAGGGRLTEADHQGDGQELQQTHFYISFLLRVSPPLPSVLSYHNENLHLADIFPTDTKPREDQVFIWSRLGLLPYTLTLTRLHSTK